MFNEEVFCYQSVDYIRYMIISIHFAEIWLYVSDIVVVNFISNSQIQL